MRVQLHRRAKVLVNGKIQILQDQLAIKIRSHDASKMPKEAFISALTSGRIGDEEGKNFPQKIGRQLSVSDAQLVFLVERCFLCIAI
jgi:hypothetical protein